MSAITNGFNLAHDGSLQGTAEHSARRDVEREFLDCAGRILVRGADFGETLPEQIRQLRFDLGRDEADAVEILDVDFVLEAEAGEFHADQVGDGGDQGAFDTLGGGENSGTGSRSSYADFFSDEDEVHAASRCWDSANPAACPRRRHDDR